LNVDIDGLERVAIPGVVPWLSGLAVRSREHSAAAWAATRSAAWKKGKSFVWTPLSSCVEPCRADLPEPASAAVMTVRTCCGRPWITRVSSSPPAACNELRGGILHQFLADPAGGCTLCLRVRHGGPTLRRPGSQWRNDRSRPHRPTVERGRGELAYGAPHAAVVTYRSRSRPTSLASWDRHRSSI